MGVGSHQSLEIYQLFQSDDQSATGQKSHLLGEVDVPRTLGFRQASTSLELLAVKGEHVFLVSSDQEDRRPEVLGQRLQPGHVQRARALSLPPYGQGAATQEEEAGEPLPRAFCPQPSSWFAF